VVTPLCEWPSEKADAMSASARDIIASAKHFDSLNDAIADIDYLFASTVRPRDMYKDAIVSQDLPNHMPSNLKAGILFGGERCGLANEELAIADKIVTVVTNEECSSLNLAQSVALLCYELQRKKTMDVQLSGSSHPAPKSEVNGLLEQMFIELDKTGYYHATNKRDAMMETITNMFTRTSWNEQEVRTFRGIVRNLTRK
jgi:tRNA/rRNA methyltransferase